MHLLIPDLLLPREHVADVLGGLALPGLAALLRDAQTPEREGALPEFQRSMPATRWLLRAFGVETAPDAAPVAPYCMLADGADPGADTWFALTPCHFAPARDHVQLGAAELGIAPDEAAALHAAAATMLVEPGVELRMAAPNRWYYRHPALEALVTAEPARALGRNIDLWLPEVAPGGDPAPRRLWRRLHNEVQMLWHAHPVNQAREARGLPTVNALWLYGAGRLPPAGAAATRAFATAEPADSDIGQHPTKQRANDRRTAVPGAPFATIAARADQVLLRGLATAARLPQVPRTPDGGADLVVLDELSAAAIREDWSAWRDALGALEREWFAPLAARGAPVALTPCSETGWQTRAGTRARWKFWRRTPLAEALAA